MQWDQPFLEALNRSRPAWDEPPDWRAALTLYQSLSHAEAAELDHAVLAMIDEDYRNPAASEEEVPFGDVLVNLPAGMRPDDLLCIEAAVLVAAERRLGGAYFAFNRLMRSPRWHAMYPRLHWLARESMDAQRKLAATPAGRYVGAVVGLAVGDALGAALEFKSREEIRSAYPEGFREITGGGPFGVAPGEWTDDTAMALAVAGGIAEAPTDPVDAVGRRFIDWYRSGPPSVGNTCRLAMDAFERTGSWSQAAAEVRAALGERTAGNGALMRTLPTALAYGTDVKPALAIGRMTHPHADSDGAIAVYQLAVAAALCGVATREGALAAGLTAWDTPDRRLAHLGELTEDQIRASGYVVDTLAAALWCFLTTSSLEECLVRAVNLGDDTDTVGALAGGLAGAYYGPAAIPRRWSTAIRNREQLEEAAEALFAVARRMDAQ